MNYYDIAKERLLNNRNAKKIGNNTYGREVAGPGDERRIFVKYHDTDIMEIRQRDGAIVLHDGGFRTTTTKRRFEELLPKLGCPWRVFAHKGQWLIGKGWQDPDSYVYQDGITLMPSGEIVGAMSPKGSADQLKLAKDINTYAKAYAELLFSGEMPEPSGGDCWACAFRDAVTGKAAMGNDHLLSHIEDKYYVPSLLPLATTEIELLSKYAKGAIHCLWRPFDSHPETLERLKRDDFAKKQVQKVINNYMRKQLGLSAVGLKRKTKGYGY